MAKSFHRPIESLEQRQLLATFAAQSGVTYSRTAEISSGDTLTFNAQAGELLLFSVRSVQNSYIEVTAPGNNVLYSQSGWSRLIALNATATGAYTLNIFAPGPGDTVAYDLTPFFASGTQAGDQTDVVESGRRRGWAMSPGDVDVLYADLTAGASGFISLAETSAGPLALRTYIVRPDGTVLDTVSTSTGTTSTFSAATAGRYHFVTVAQDPSISADYGISLGIVPGPQYGGDADTAPLMAGTTRRGNLPTGDIDVFTVGVPAGGSATLTIRPAAGSNYTPSASVFNAAGTLIDSDASSEIVIDLTTGPAQNFFVVLRGSTGTVGGEYDVSYQTVITSGALSLVNTKLVVNGTTGNDDFVLTRGSNTFVLTGTLAGSITATGVTGLDVFPGNGNDRVNLAAAGVRAYVFAGDGDDTVQGSIFDDVLVGGSGRNRLFGGDGNDRLTGSGGRDFLYGEGGDDRLYGQAGNDNLDGGGNIDRIFAGDGDDLLIGSGSNDKLFGEAGTDTLLGGRNFDYLNGGEGTDSADREPGETVEFVENFL
jgi:Ca2+-binding RTX toxin-like protein